MSAGILVCDDQILVSTFSFNTDTGTLDECGLVTVDARPSFALIPKQQPSFTPPHKKNRRGKFKRSGK